MLCMLILLNTSILADAELRKKIGQMIMVGFNGTSVPDSLAVDIKQRNLGGVILFSHNMVNPDQISRLTTQLKSLAETPLLIATDQEGGHVARLYAGNGFQNSYSAFQLGTIINSEDTTRATASRMAEWLSRSGINMNLAPVVDVNVNPSSPAIGYWERSFSDNPETVFSHAFWFVDEFRNQNIITTLKHFPGHGSAKQDSHDGFTDITMTWSESELVPYRNMFTLDYADVVMSGHLYNANLDTLYPASLSSNVIDTLLRKELGYQGIVISDEMFMGAISYNYPFEEALERAINAGTDILLYRTNLRNTHSLVNEIIAIVAEKVKDGKIAESRIDASYQSILALKEKRLDTSSLDDGQPLPETFILHQNFPNPFNAKTIIAYDLPAEGYVSIVIYDLLGRVVKHLVQGTEQAGYGSITWDGRNNDDQIVSAGVYLYRIQTGNFSNTRKMILLK